MSDRKKPAQPVDPLAHLPAMYRRQPEIIDPGDPESRAWQPGRIKEPHRNRIPGGKKKRGGLLSRGRLLVVTILLVIACLYIVSRETRSSGEEAQREGMTFAVSITDSKTGYDLVLSITQTEAESSLSNKLVQATASLNPSGKGLAVAPDKLRDLLPARKGEVRLMAFRISGEKSYLQNGTKCALSLAVSGQTPLLLDIGLPTVAEAKP